MAFNQFILSLGSNSPLHSSLVDRLSECGYELTKLDIDNLISDDTDLETLTKRIEDAFVAQDIAFLLLEGKYINENTISYIPSLIKSVAKEATRNGIKKIIIYTSMLENYASDYSIIAKVYYTLLASRVNFVMKNNLEDSKHKLKTSFVKEEVDYKLQSLID